MKALAALVVLVSLPALADSFVLKNGKTYEGVIQKELGSGYLVKLKDGGVRTIRFDEIDDMNAAPSIQPAAVKLVPQAEGVSPTFHKSMLGLKDEWADLREDRASIGVGMPVLGMVFGSAMALAGSSTYSASSSTGASGVYAAGFTTMVTGIVVAVASGGWLTINLVRRANYSREIEEVERRMRNLRPDGT